MTISVKREAEVTGGFHGRREACECDDEYDSVRQKSHVKKERLSKNGPGSARPTQEPKIQDNEQEIADRRALRSQYLTLIHQINDAKGDLTTIDSDKFNRIINEVENLHQKVQKPREQIADAEALLDIASSLMSSVKSQSASGVSPAEFVNVLISGFGQTPLGIDADETKHASMNWKDIGFAFCSSVMVSCGCSTMMGPMDKKLKQRKRAGKRTYPGAGARPEEVDDTEKKTDTDNNMAIMFDILRKNKRVKLENLVFNRRSFAQTVENLFALSFLVKDGRVNLIVDKSGSHFALPKNAPASNLVMSGEVVYNHFVFRYDFKDWKLMSTMVAEDEELMPHRETTVSSSVFASQDSQTTPIRKLSRNRGLVKQEDTVVEDSPDIDDGEVGEIRRKSKLRKLT